MSIDGRLDKLTPALTAKERAILVLRAWKEEREEDAAVRRTMPPSQALEFNRYIHLMNAANLDVGKYTVVLHMTATQLGSKSAWLASLQMWGIRVWDLAQYILLHTNEPITESEHRRLAEKARAEMVLVAELAEVLVESYDGWTEADMEQAEDGDDEQVVTGKAWNRLLAEKKRELTRLVEEGTLAGRRRGRGLLINNGSFYDWLGEPVPVCPDWGNGYDVLPDDQAERVESLKKDRLRAQKAIAGSPASPILEFLEEKLGCRVTERQERWDEAMVALRESLREGVPWCWQELRAAEMVLDEVAEELGEDPLLPPVRQVLDKTHQDLVELHALLRFVDADCDLPEPDEERVEFLRQRWLRQDG
ncbi:MAG: hypothetical protein ABSD56_11665 [Bryobacteraceae bacterium]